MKKFVFLVFLGLTACATTPPTPQVVTKQIHVPITVPASVYQCTVTAMPPTNNLTDIGVSKLIAQQHYDLKTCKNSLNSVKKIIDNSNKLAK